ncbi:flagellar protein FlaG [Alteromonas sp. 5E99-2]|uniref:flagellar protein FlaG n=1 Tax=Alteromonas sp. 5E99-2 TaxID=2817683 RepID=UPI001A980243|nr:flagellar protein FlaG [Alteromonas sp. 5E99-2]MBO1255254.1 flagellar protein FlaG [Alteromonas sp. 5E99-2]
MTINSLQVGQNIAASNVTVERTSSPQTDEQSTNVNTEIPLRTDNTRVNVTSDTQESSTGADNLDSESNNEALQEAVEEVESFVQGQSRNLAFSVDDETERAIVTVRDSSSGDVIRQIPSEEVLELADRIQSLQDDIGSSVGVLINRQV